VKWQSLKKDEEDVMNHIHKAKPHRTELSLRHTYLDAMSCIASSVNIVTTDGPAGRGGVTVTAMSSVSADASPPVLLVCLHHLSRTTEAIRENGVFCVNVLGEDQHELSNTFAGRGDAERFSSGTWTTMETGSPRLHTSLAAFDCRVSKCLVVDSHFVVFGEVEGIFMGEPRPPLLYANRDYAKIR
jgi:flavin reductase